MKSKNIKAAALIAALCTLFLAVSPSASYSWYCMRKKNHERPSCESNMSFIENYKAYYLGSDEKVLYLTFDAGYENGNVERILDTLKKHNVPAAFFVLENLIKRNTDLVKRMESENHLVCNHTSRHKDMTRMSKDEFESELRSLEKTAEENGITMKRFYRPPEGKFSEENLKYAEEMGYKTVLWSLAYADWDNNRQPSCGGAMKILTDNLHNGAIILLHPTSKTNADILDEFLKYCKNEGYRFGSLDELS